MGGMAVHPDGKRLAMGCSNEVKVFEVSFDSVGVPSLKLLHSVKPAMGANTVGLSYDLAGNLYVISNSSERLGVWAMPKSDNRFVTSAPSEAVIVVLNTDAGELNVEEAEVRMYPNPVDDELSVSVSGGNLSKIELYDLNGRLLLVKLVSGSSVQLPMSDFAKGTYLIRISYNNKVLTKQLLKK